MFNSHLCEVAHVICYQGLIINNLFVSVITNRDNIAYIRRPQPHPRWVPLGVMKCCIVPVWFDLDILFSFYILLKRLNFSLENVDLQGNSWLWEVGGMKLLVDPILVGNLDFGIPWLYDAAKKFLKNFQVLSDFF